MDRIHIQLGNLPLKNSILLNHKSCVDGTEMKTPSDQNQTSQGSNTPKSGGSITTRIPALKTTAPTTTPTDKTPPQWAAIYSRLFPTNSNLTPLSMLHCATVFTDAAFLDKSKLAKLIERSELPDSDVDCGKARGDFRYVSILHNTIRIVYAKYRGVYRIQFIWVDLARLLYGHSGRVIETAEDMFLALSLYNREMNNLLEPSSKDRALPGLVVGCKTYWGSLEIPMQLLDADGSVLRALRHAKHSSVRKSALTVAGESVRWKGTLFCLQVYLKCIQLKQKYNHEIKAVDEHTLRFEVILKSTKLSVSFGGTTNDRLQTFQLTDLYPVFLKGMEGIEGAYKMSAVTTPKELTNPEKFIHSLLSEPGNELVLDDMVDLYVDVTGAAARKKSEMKKNVRALLNHQSSIPLSKIFPAQQPANKQMSPLRKQRDSEGVATGSFVDVGKKLDYSLIYPGIRQAYSATTFISYDDYKESLETGFPRLSPLTRLEHARRADLYKN